MNPAIGGSDPAKWIPETSVNAKDDQTPQFNVVILLGVAGFLLVFLIVTAVIKSGIRAGSGTGVNATPDLDLWS